MHFQIGPATAQTVASLFIRHFGQYLFGGGTEFLVGYQFFKYGRKLFRVVRTDFVEFFSVRISCKVCYDSLFSMMSVNTSFMSIPAARTCWGMKLVAVMPGVVLTSNMLIRSLSLPFSSVVCVMI